MKTKIMLTSIIFMLLALPSEAKSVYFAVVSESLVSDVPNLDGLDVIIKTNGYDIDYYFKNGDLNLNQNQELIIRGGRSSIATELDKYKKRKVQVLRSAMVGRTVVSLQASGCYIRKPIGTDNTTYVMIRDSLSFKPSNYCNNTLNINYGNAYPSEVTLKQVIDALPQLH